MSNEFRFKDVESPSEIEPIDWYDPSQLIDTANRVMESETITRYADRRTNYTDRQGKEPVPITFLLAEEPVNHQLENSDIKCIGFHRKEKNPDDWQLEMWVDFLADTGDSGNATYTVAKTLFQDPLALTYHDNLAEDNPIRKQYSKGLPSPLPRADLLIFGGDLVYPVANDESYQTRFVNLFEGALSGRQNFPIEEKATRAVLSFPQNHDWYDNLSSFYQIFCHNDIKTFLDMKCPQNRSYAAVKLPFNWWLFGLDLALSDDIDEVQHLYFSKIIANADLNESSKIIITYKEPIWFLTALGNTKNKKRTYLYEQLEFAIEQKTKREIDIRLAGDQHYYRRYSTNDLKQRSHLITCGSGGAFCHPTHGPEIFNIIDRIKPTNDSNENFISNAYQFSEKSSFPTGSTRYEKKVDYPSSTTSWNLSIKNFRYFFYINPKFGIITAFSYMLLIWANFSSLYSNIKYASLKASFFTQDNVECYQEKNWYDDKLDLFSNLSCAWRLWSWSSILEPVNGFIGLFIISGFIFFAQKFNPHDKVRAGIIGALHGAVHFFTVFLVYWITLFILSRDPIQHPLEILPFIKTSLLVLLFGYIFGSYIMGWYLFISLNFFRKKQVKYPTLVTLFMVIWFVFSLWFGGFSNGLQAMTVVSIFFVLLFCFFSLILEVFFNRTPKNQENKIPSFLHSNEAFSSLQIQDYKGFLRFKITKDRLEAFFIGIDKIPLKWKKVGGPNQPKWEADDAAIQPKLVDYWTVETAKDSVGKI